jgi:hypothetical protein
MRLLGINRNVPLTAYRWVFRAVAIGLNRQSHHRRAAVHEERHHVGDGAAVSRQDGVRGRQRGDDPADSHVCVEQRRGPSEISDRAAHAGRSRRSSRGPLP